LLSSRMPTARRGHCRSSQRIPLFAWAPPVDVDTEHQHGRRHAPRDGGHYGQGIVSGGFRIREMSVNNPLRSEELSSGIQQAIANYETGDGIEAGSVLEIGKYERFFPAHSFGVPL